MVSRVKWVVVSATAVLAVSPGAAQAVTRAYSPLDKQMLQTSIQGDRFEIAGGKLAGSKATTPSVRSLAARLIRDHSKSLREAITVARRLGIGIPSSPTPPQEWELQTVASMSGDSFDAAYSYLEVQDHKQDIDDTKTEIAHGLNADIRDLARTDLPVLRTHLRLSQNALWAVPGTWPPEPTN